MKTARESAYALMAIVDDVLDFSKIEAGQFDIEHQPMDVTAVVESACDALRPLSESQAVGLRLYTDPRLPRELLGDAVRLRQVLTNLLGNAIKFSHGLDRRGTVSLRALRVADTLVLEVADNGIGMAPETLRRLFSPFTQADASTTRRFGGTGLGLSISHRLVSLMGGEVEVRSVMDEGTTFTVRLPMAPLPDQDTRPLSVPQPLAGLPCLVLGNDTDLGADLSDYLNHAGALATCLQTSEQAQAWLRSGGLERCVVVVTGTAESSDLMISACRAAVAERPELALAFVVVEDGGWGQAHRQALGYEWLSGECLHRAKFLRSVALAARWHQPEAAVEAPPYVSPERDDSLPGARPLILVAEDNEINQKVLSHQLGLLGYRAEMVANGAEALASWRRGGHALLLTDLHMPVMDGYTLAAAVRAEESGTARIPIIALTANALREEERRCRQAGMDAYMSKPVRLGQLRATIDAWLRPVATPALLPRDAVIDEGTPTVQTPVDLRVLADLLAGDTEGMQQVLMSFRANTAGSAQAMADAHAAGAVQTLFDIAHKLKSTARAIGAAHLGQVCADIEEAVGNKSHSAMLDALVFDFEVELLSVRDFLDRQEASGG